MPERPFLRKTPLWRVPGALLGVPCAELWLKLEHQQVSGSFKARGMLNRLLAQPSGSWGGFSFEMMPLELRECTRDLTMTVLDVVAPDGEMTLSLYINYRADVFDQATAERLAALLRIPPISFASRRRNRSRRGSSTHS